MRAAYPTRAKQHHRHTNSSSTGTPTRTAATVVVMLLLIAGCHWIDYNPTVQPREILGSWKRGASTLRLEANGSFTLEEPSRRTGTWRLTDWNLTLAFTGAGEELWRVIRVDAAPEIVPRWKGMDLSSGESTFKRTSGKDSRD
jgi:hypothetical protein